MAKIKTNGQLLTYRLLIQASKPVVLRMVAFDPSKEHTVYADRGYQKEVVLICADHATNKENCNLDIVPFQGRKWFEFPMPIRPDKVQFRVTNQRTGDNHGIRVVKKEHVLTPYPTLTEDATTRRFIRFATDFAKKAGHVNTGVYTSEGNEFVIRYLRKVRNRDNGVYKNTPAQVSHETGLIEASKDYFKQMSVNTRLFVLLHEYCHWYHENYEEGECDMFAARVCLQLGMGQVEIMYALAKLFEYNGHAPSDVKSEQTARVANMVAFLADYGVKKAA